MEYLEDMLVLQDEFLSRWTYENVQNMSLEDYTSVGNTDTFTYWLESKTTDVISIWGGSSYKFGIFKRNPESEQKELRDRQCSDGEYGWYSKYGQTKEEAFSNVKSSILNIIRLSQIKEFEKIDPIDLGNAVKWKIAFLYAPKNSLLRIVKDKALYYLAKKHLGLKSKNIAEIQNKLIEQKPNDIDLNNYSIQLWKEYTAFKSNQPRKYWLYAPGENARKWDEFYDQGIMGLGWDNLGDLRDYKNKEQIRAKLQSLENTEGSKKNDTTANYDFLNNINIGDIIIAKKGKSEYLGYGVVESEYYYDVSRDEYQQCRKVNWKKKGIWEEPKKDIVLKTLTDITKYDDYVKKLIDLLGIEMSDANWKDREKEFRNWAINTVKRASSIDGYIRNSMNKKIPEELIELGERNETFVSIFQEDDISKLKQLSERLLKGDLIEFNQNTNSREPSAAINKYINFLEKQGSKDMSNTTEIYNKTSLNTILYGPPGTGKTYNTINETLKIIDPIFYNANIIDRNALKERFDELKKSGQVDFVTFHQSYGYEEFVEGIKAIPVGSKGNEDGNEMIYDVVPGIFKKISKRAKEVKSGSDKTGPTKYYLNASQLNIQATMIKEDENTYTVLSGSKIRKDESNTFNSKPLKKKVLDSIKKVEEDEWYVTEENYTFKSMSGASSIILGRQSNGFKEWKEVLDDENNLSESSNENFSEKVNYVLIIDEINRGNISKIFGELITLIEDSKRQGEEEAVEITLPYSGEKFSVPNNFYILGTMNTADRSIALMDTALRRRFEFKEMMPKAELLSDTVIKGVNIAKLLMTINKRVDYLYDRDHTIGHAYFMSLKDLDENDALSKLDDIFRNKIIPLLQEYFYDDWEKIQIVLGDHPRQNSEIQDKFIVEKLQEEESILGFDHDDIENEQFNYSINDTFTIDAYLKLSL